MTLVDGPQDGATEVTVWDLEMTDPGALKPSGEPKVAATLLRAAQPAPELSRFFYQLVGEPWYWVDRLGWDPERWLQWVDRPQHHLTTCWVDGVPAGYYELEQQETSVEIAYFGLTERFIGRGLGGWLLTEAIRHAWTVDTPDRVWLHTCSLDGPAALGNYQARGLEICGQSSEWRMVKTPAT